MSGATEKFRYQQSYFRVLKKVKLVDLLHLGNWELKLYIYLLGVTGKETPVIEDWYWKPFNMHELLGISRATYHKALSGLKSLGLIESENAVIMSSHNGRLVILGGTQNGNIEIPENQRIEKTRGTESIIRDRLQQVIGGETEVPTPVGQIDLLTETELIEVKYAPDWKSAMGQALAYSLFYPSHAKRIHLFGTSSDEVYVAQAKIACDSFQIAVSFEEVSNA